MELIGAMFLPTVERGGCLGKTTLLLSKDVTIGLRGGGLRQE